MRIALRILLPGLLLAMAAAGGLAAWVATTESGLRFVAARASALLPLSLDAEAVSGRLIGPMTLGSIEWRAAGLSVEIERLELDWRPAALLRRAVHVRHLDAAGVRIARTGGAEPDPAARPGGGDWQQLALPWGVEVDALTLELRQFSDAGASVLEGLQVSLSGRARGQRLALRRVSVEHARGRLAGRATLSLHRSDAWDVDLAWELATDAWQAAGETRLAGKLAAVEVTQSFTAPARARIQGTLHGLPARPSWDVELQVQSLPRAGPWPEWLEGAAATLALEGTLEDSRFDGRLDWPARLPAALALRGVAGWDAGALRVPELVLGMPSGAELRAAGELAPGDTLSARVALQGEALRWPLESAEPQLLVRAMTLDGRLEGQEWSGTATASLASPGLPAARAELSARGDFAGMALERLEAELLDGRAIAQGEIGWSEGLAADLALELQGLDPAGLWPDWPGRIDGNIRMQSLPARAGAHRLLVDALDGELRGLPLHATAAAVVAPPGLELDHARAQLGPMALEASGLVDAERMELEASAEVPELQALHASARGALEARLEAAGPRAAPRLALSASGTELRWDSFQVGTLSVAADLDMSGEAASSLSARLEGIAPQRGRSASASLDASGTPGEHRVRFAYSRQRPEQLLSVELEGALEDAAWRALLQDLRVEESGQRLWSLRGPAQLRVSGERSTLETACLDGVLGFLCLEGTRSNAGPWRGSATLARLDLGPIGDWLESGLELRGSLTGRVEVSADANRFVGMTGGFGLTGGEVRARGRAGPPALAWEGGALQFSGDARQARGELRLALQGEDALEAGLGIGWNDSDPALDGRLQATLTQLGLLSELVPELSRVEGRAQLEATLAGTLAAPAPSLSFQWLDGAAAIPLLGIEPKELELRADLAGDTLSFEAAGRSGEGRFTSSGRFDLAADAVEGEAGLDGDRVLVADLPDVRLLASPELRFRYSPGRLLISGAVAIPEGQISGVGGTSAVSVSPDEVIISPRDTPAEDELAVVSRIRVSVGPDVHIQGAGLKGRVDGRLLVVAENDEAPWGRGELRTTEGTFGAFGQQLQIERGRLLYDGGPLANPGLEIRAVREVDGVTAGALVRGTLEQPELSLFSDPPMSRAETLSYLSFGKGLDSLQSTEQGTINRMANSMALSGSGLVVQDLARRLGLGDLSVTAETSADASALVVGKYLGGGLYVSYGLGLFDTVNTLRLRYQVNRRLSLEATSGEETAADIFYSFERD